MNKEDWKKDIPRLRDSTPEQGVFWIGSCNNDQLK